LKVYAPVPRGAAHGGGFAQSDASGTAPLEFDVLHSSTLQDAPLWPAMTGRWEQRGSASVTQRAPGSLGSRARQPA
jgi:hypothetical protein